MLVKNFAALACIELQKTYEANIKMSQKADNLRKSGEVKMT